MLRLNAGLSLARFLGFARRAIPVALHIVGYGMAARAWVSAHRLRLCRWLYSQWLIGLLRLLGSRLCRHARSIPKPYATRCSVRIVSIPPSSEPPNSEER